MNKTPITIWVTITEPAIENGKIIVKKGEFYYNKQKYLIIDGEIFKAIKNINEIPTTMGE